MGLDMYAYTVQKSKSEHSTTNGQATDEDRADFHYWRKHNRLHGWMEELYKEQCEASGVDTEEFNCIPVRLRNADLDRLHSDILCRDLPITEGFFFGKGYDYSPDHENDDIEFITKARHLLATGLDVYYNSWW